MERNMHKQKAMTICLNLHIGGKINGIKIQ